MKIRYECWAGRGIPKEWEYFGFEDPSGVIWPIVDLETCGPIDGYPKPEQWYCVALDHNIQDRICRLLNKEESNNRCKNCEYYESFAREANKGECILLKFEFELGEDSGKTCKYFKEIEE